MKDRSKIWSKPIETLSLISKDSGGGIYNAGMIQDGQAKIIATPVTTKTIDGQTIVMAWDVSAEILLMQIEDYKNMLIFNGKETTLVFEDWQELIDSAAENPADESDFRAIVKNLDVQVMTDVQPDGKANVKITGNRRVETLNGNVFIFTNQEILDMVEDYQVVFNVTAASTVNITLTGSNGTIDWGDGEVTHLQKEQKTYTHAYSAAGSFTITQAHELTYLRCNTPEVSGDISAVSGLTGLNYLSLRNTQVSGDISAVSGLTNLANLSIGSTQVSGDISAVSGLTNLTYLYFYNTQSSGDISAVSGLTNLTSLYLSDTQVFGDISAVSGLTNLANLSIGSTQVSGDISAVSGLTNLTYLYLSNTQVRDYTSVALPSSWDGININVKDLYLDQSEVDAFLSDLDASGSENGTLDISGTNAVPSTDGDASINNLQTKGWTITYNSAQ